MNEFTLNEFLLELRKHWKRIVLNTFIAAVVGLVIAFSIPKQFTSYVSLAPELADDAKMGGMSSLASLAGIDFGQGADAIGPDMYPNVVATNSFLVNLLSTPVKTILGDTCTFHQYLILHTKMPWWNYGKVWLMKLVKNLRPKKPAASHLADDGINPKCLTEEEEILINGIRGAILCNVNEENGIITLSVNTQDPLVSTIMVDTVKVHLQKFITQYRTNKARVDLAYYRTLEDSTKYAYEKAKQIYANFCDSHREVTLQSYLSDRETLENELQMAFSAYSQVKQQVQLAQAKVQEDTPAFTVLEDSSVPNVPDSPRKVLILFACVFIGFFGTVGWTYFRLFYSK